MERELYREAGSRTRSAYRLTAAGQELQLVLSALQQWGDDHLPLATGTTMLRRVTGTDRPVHVGYLDDGGREVEPGEVAIVAVDGVNSSKRPSRRASNGAAGA